MNKKCDKFISKLLFKEFGEAVPIDWRKKALEEKEEKLKIATENLKISKYLEKRAKRQNTERKPKLFCVCLKKEEGEYMFCEDCKDWFHPKCINMTKETFETLKQSTKKYTCKFCLNEKNEEIAENQGLLTEENMQKRKVAELSWDSEMKKTVPIQFRIAQGYVPKTWIDLLLKFGQKNHIDKAQQDKILFKIQLKIITTMKYNYRTMLLRQRQWRQEEGINLHNFTLYSRKKQKLGGFRDNSVK